MRKLPLKKKDLRTAFQVTAESYIESQDFLCVLAFALVIKPVADRYGWTIDWGMGSVSFENSKGVYLYEGDSKAVDNIGADLYKLLKGILPETKCGYLWFVMCGLGNYNRYHKETGLQLVRS